MTLEVTEITKKLILVGVDVRSLSGTIKRDDSTAEKEVFTAGSVRYIAPDALRHFTAARQASIRVCRAYGTRFWGAWAVPEESIPALSAELEKIAKRVEESKADVVQHWDEKLAEWAALHGDAINPYRSRFPSKAAADRGIGISISAVRITPAEKIVAIADDAVESETLGMPMRILEEIAQDVRDSWKPGAQKATQAIKSLLNRIRHKCQTLAFVGGNLGDVADLVENTLSSLPDSGEIVGHDFLRLAGLLSLLERPEVVATGNFALSLADDAASDGIQDPEAEQAETMVAAPTEQSESNAAAAFGW